MGKILIFLVLIAIFLTSCSSEPSSVEQQSDPERVEVLKNPTPVLQTPEAGAVYVSENGETDSAELRPVYETFCLRHISAKKASEALSRLLPEAVYAEGEGSGILIVKAVPRVMCEARSVIRSIDRPVPQIMIESRIVEITENGLKILGVTWGNPSGSFNFSYDPDSGKFSPEKISSVLNMLITKGQARLIANPRISTLDNTEADVNIGSKIPYAVPVSSASTSTQWAVQYIDAGVSLKITPKIGDDGQISVLIHPEVSAISEWRMTAAGEFPVISTRNADALVRVRDGETIIVGGLIDETERENVSKIPLAGDIPLVKELFMKRVTEKTKTEIVFMITPRVI